MLFQKYMEAEADEIEQRIDDQFEDGEIDRDEIINLARSPCERANDVYRTAEWFEVAHHDDLSKDAYLIVSGNEVREVEQWPEDGEPRHLVHKFIHQLKNLDGDGVGASTWAWSEDGDRAAIVFEAHDDYPDFPSDV